MTHIFLHLHICEFAPHEIITIVVERVRCAVCCDAAWFLRCRSRHVLSDHAEGHTEWRHWPPYPRTKCFVSGVVRGSFWAGV